MKFKKALPNPFAFSPLPEFAYDLAGTVQHRPVETLILARLLAGHVWHERTVRTHTGREERMERGSTWASLRTLASDYSAATGCSCSRSNVVTAISRLTKMGLIQHKDAFQSKGRMGKMFQLPPRLTDAKGTVDVLQAHRLFTFGPVDDYRFAGKKMEFAPGEFTRHTYGDLKVWEAYILKNGSDQPAYRTVGQWRYGERGEADAPVFVPWIVVDIDRPFYPDAHADVITAISDFQAAGYDEKSMFVSFSGSKGFHVILSTAKIANPIFRSSNDAASIIGEFVTGITNVDCDASTFNPLQVYRLSGSRNSNSGLYKTTYTISDFVGLALDKLYANAKTPTAWTMPASMIEADEALITTLRQSANKTLSRKFTKRGQRKGAWNGIGPVIAKILDGVEEGEAITDTHVGRNKAAFLLSCFILEHPEQHKAVRERLGLSSNDELGEQSVALETITYWYTQKCDRGSHSVKVTEPFNSAVRTINRKYGSR